MSKKPDFSVYHVAERGEGKKGFWTKIGAAWSHEDGEGFNITLDLMPIAAGRIVVRKPKADEADTGAPEGGE